MKNFYFLQNISSNNKTIIFFDNFQSSSSDVSNDVNNLLNTVEEAMDKIERECDMDTVDVIHNESMSFITENVSNSDDFFINSVDCLQVDVNRDKSVNEILLDIQHSNSAQIIEAEIKSPLNVPTTNSSIEISDSRPTNILNIYTESDIVATNLLPGINKTKPIIEVLSDSNNTDTNDFTPSEYQENTDEQYLNESTNTKHLHCGEINKCSTKIHTVTENCGVMTNTNSTTKASAITFFCENLDELKQSDSDSYESLEDI